MLGILGGVLILLLLNLYMQWILSGYWQEERAAERTALAETRLTKVTKTDKFVWDETAWVIQGTDQAGEGLFVWVTDNGAEAVKAGDGYPRAQLKADVLRELPDAKLIRIRPGLLDGEKVWEVYYSRKMNVQRHYYGFYGFADGRSIVTYKLPVRSSGS
ncbi:cell wall elongation regulator TseB-like domain-containing protein [Paenibacillus darwinianus]|uniref:cell wall elongation regulator TseB-like domain-containing protein n=1 Tax=Paenibacillus darwinianus TaxID=1380763 RepID=UPI00044AC570|nr:DUF5590 domain-containing protein [Paenibacillus darwinianus]EXX91172.1 hypothetical protein BG52_11145 [Paenibacillus darwinianus]EXX92637.1 hypothetical protein CH50_08290 [Paenibacillus darwinianus]